MLTAKEFVVGAVFALTLSGCSGSGNTPVDPTPSKVTASIKASAPSVMIGESYTIDYSCSSGTESAVISWTAASGGSVSAPISGSQTFIASNPGTVTYSVVCSGDGQADRREVSVVINPFTYFGHVSELVSGTGTGSPRAYVTNDLNGFYSSHAGADSAEVKLDGSYNIESSIGPMNGSCVYVIIDEVNQLDRHFFPSVHRECGSSGLHNFRRVPLRFEFPSHCFFAGNTVNLSIEAMVKESGYSPGPSFLARYSREWSLYLGVISWVSYPRTFGYDTVGSVEPITSEQRASFESLMEDLNKRLCWDLVVPQKAGGSADVNVGIYNDPTNTGRYILEGNGGSWTAIRGDVRFVRTNALGGNGLNTPRLAQHEILHAVAAVNHTDSWFSVLDSRGAAETRLTVEDAAYVTVKRWLGEAWQKSRATHVVCDALLGEMMILKNRSWGTFDNANCY